MHNFFNKYESLHFNFDETVPGHEVPVGHQESSQVGDWLLYVLYIDLRQRTVVIQGILHSTLQDRIGFKRAVPYRNSILRFYRKHHWAENFETLFQNLRQRHIYNQKEKKRKKLTRIFPTMHLTSSLNEYPECRLPSR